MINTNACPRRLVWVAVLIVLLISAMTLTAMADNTSTEDMQPAVITRDTKVYKRASTSSASIRVSEGMQVNLVAVKGKWAMVENKGIYAYMNADHVSPLMTNPIATPTPAPEIDHDALMKDAEPAVITADTRVYKKASTSSASIKVKAGMKVNLLCVDGKWALVENNGVYAYINAELVIPEAELPAATPTPTPAPTADHDALMKDAEPAVITADTCVYKKASTSSASIKVKAGMEVNLLAINGKWALVENNGIYAYINASQVTRVADLPAATATPTPAPTPNYDDLMASAEPAIINDNTRVYKRASTSSPSVKVQKGMNVNLLAINGKWALIENNGVYAYINASLVSPLATDPTATPAPNYDSLLAGAKPAVVLKDARVYQSPDKGSASTSISEGAQVSILANSGGWALIHWNGAFGYMDEDCLTTEFATPTPDPTATPKPTAEPEPDYSHLLAGAKEAELTGDAKVYKSASTSSPSTTVDKGTKVNLLSVGDGWALIERNGVYGFTQTENVALIAAPTATPTSTPAPTATPTPAPDNYLTSSQYTNEQKCYMFLTQEAGFNSAAACGIMANIRRESNFTPDIGTNYYGLVQWGGGRKTNLQKFCANNGYSASSLEGQLNFIVHELTTSYKKVYNYLNGVENTAQGAYDAGYYFCYYYEVPANRTSSSQTRGALARDTYFPKYN